MHSHLLIYKKKIKKNRSILSREIKSFFSQRLCTCLKVYLQKKTYQCTARLDSLLIFRTKSKKTNRSVLWPQRNRIIFFAKIVYVVKIVQLLQKKAYHWTARPTVLLIYKTKSKIKKSFDTLAQKKDNPFCSQRLCTWLKVYLQNKTYQGRTVTHLLIFKTKSKIKKNR